jgi:hypothetical protein
MVTTNSHKIFDEYHVDCNECQRYWLDQCDGTPEDVQKPCTSFIATKKVDIPERIKVLEKRLQSLTGCVLVMNIIIIFHLLSHWLGV